MILILNLSCNDLNYIIDVIKKKKLIRLKVKNKIALLYSQ